MSLQTTSCFSQQCTGKSQNRASLQAGMVGGVGLQHMVWGQISTKTTKDISYFQIVTLCDSSKQATNSTGCRQVPCTCRGREAVPWELRTQMSETKDELKTATRQSSRPRAPKQAWETPYVSWPQVSSGTCKQGLFYTVCLLTVVRKRSAALGQDTSIPGCGSQQSLELPSHKQGSVYKVQSVALPGRSKTLLQELELCLEVIAQAQIATAQPQKPQNLKRRSWRSQRVGERCSLGLEKHRALEASQASAQRAALVGRKQAELKENLDLEVCKRHFFWKSVSKSMQKFHFCSY